MGSLCLGDWAAAKDELLQLSLHRLTIELCVRPLCNLGSILSSQDQEDYTHLLWNVDSTQEKLNRRAKQRKVYLLFPKIRQLSQACSEIIWETYHKTWLSHRRIYKPSLSLPLQHLLPHLRNRERRYFLYELHHVQIRDTEEQKENPCFIYTSARVLKDLHFYSQTYSLHEPMDHYLCQSLTRIRGQRKPGHLLEGIHQTEYLNHEFHHIPTSLFVGGDVVLASWDYRVVFSTRSTSR